MRVDKIRVALIGAGVMGGCHLDVYNTLDDVEVCALVDLDIKKAMAKAKGRDIQIYDNIEQMLDEVEVDMIDICTPTYLHPEHAIKAMEKGLHVLCEKPLALTVREAEALSEAVDKNNVNLMPAQVIRFWPEYQYLKKVYEDKRYGKLNHLTLYRGGEMPKWSWQDWMLDEKKSGRAAIDLHVHDVDYILYLLGTPRSVTAVRREEERYISSISAFYGYDDMLVQAECYWYNSCMPFTMGFRACFETAVLEYKDKKLMLYKADGGSQEIIIEKESLLNSKLNIDSVNGYYNEIRYFADCLRNGQKPEIVTPQEAVECLKVIYKEIESAEYERTVNI